VIVHGRELPSGDVDLARTVGLFAHGVPLLLRLPGEVSGPGALARIQEQLGTFGRFAHIYAATRWLDPETAASRALSAIPRRELIFNYIGQFEPVESEDSVLRAMPDVPRALEDPANLRDFLLQCQVGVLGRRLTVLWHYSENVHREETVHGLSQVFLDSLRAFLDGGRSEGEPPAGLAEAPAAQ
jgi:non-ribosomal peptide synthase protein (TIGR01720 family)